VYHVVSYTLTSILATVTAVTTTGVLTVNSGSTIGIKINEIVTLSGTAFGGLSTTTTYYVKAYTSTSISLSLSVNGSALSISGGTGSMIATVGSGTDKSAILSVDSNYSYIPLTAIDSSGSVGSTSFNVAAVATSQITILVGMIFGWGSRVHRITGYQTPAQLGQTYGRITFTNLNGGTGLSNTTNPASYGLGSITIRAGLNNLNSDNTPVSMSLTSQISVMRASGHDLVDIGTGGFADSNIPTNIYGPPVNTRVQGNEVQEIGKGRVFYSTTDQDGNFRVGKYFLVDQGTGTVTFSASIALSNLDGIGFKSGVTINSFQTDDTMYDQGSNIVPTQSAVVGYINKRLGITYPGGSATINPLGPGFMALDGTTKFGAGYQGSNASMDLNSHRIINLADPSSNSDAVNKQYADAFFKRSGAIRKDIDGFVMSASTQFTIYSVARSSNVATIVLLDNSTLSGSHGLSIGSIVTVSGVNNTIAGFDGIVTVTSVPTVTSFTYASTGSTISTTLVGSAAVTSTSNIGMNNAKITKLANPTSSGDAANYDYVNTKANIAALNDVSLATNVDKQILYYDSSSTGYTGANARWRNGLLTDSNVSATASIAQSKLNLNYATAASTSVAATIGISSFNSANFSSASGYVSLATNGVALGNLATIGTGYLLGNTSGATAAPAQVTFANALSAALQTAYVGSAGLLAKGTGATFSIVNYDTANTASAIVQRDSNNAINVGAVSSSGQVSGSSLSTSGGVSCASVSSTGSISATGISGTSLSITTGTISGPTVSTQTLTTGAASTAGTITGKWTLSGTSTLQATYADLAEYYTSDSEYAFGTIVMIGGEQDVTLAKGYGNTAVAGVVSENPAYTMNAGCEGTRVAVALQGRVPCKVVGTITKGDLLIVSQVPGVATASTDPRPGSIIGKALESYDSSRVGMIEVLVGKH
jgi:hypothetical protein